MQYVNLGGTGLRVSRVCLGMGIRRLIPAVHQSC
jgi:hypothetical protein